MHRIGIVHDSAKSRARVVPGRHRALLTAGILSLLLLISMLVNAAAIG